MYSQNIFDKPLIWGIRVWQVLTFLAVYTFFAFQYWLALWYTTNGATNMWRELLIDYYLLKLVFTIPLWWLYFIHWRNRSIAFKMTMHLFTCAMWIFLWFKSYRWIQDSRGARYLMGDGIWWDIYIPFLVYCVQFSVFHVYDYYLQTHKQKQKEKELMQLAYNSEVNALKAQIQPHFLFNTLNSISASVPREMEHTRELIAKLADTFRYSLQSCEKEWISLSEELQFIKITLDLEKERLKKRLNVEFDIDNQLLSTKIPPMLLQPFTENAIRHGIAPRLEGGTVLVKAEKANQKIRITISDTGMGFAGPDENLTDIFNGKGIGLRNSSQRLEKLFGEEITVKRNSPSGLIFSFHIPIVHE